MRTAFNIYRTLGKFLEEVDAAAHVQGKGPEDKSIDANFRSGVYLGVGLSNLILSMMPSRLLSLIELFGYKGDRYIGLQLLNRAGGWTKESDEPSVSYGMYRPLIHRVNIIQVDTEQEGVRRTICDMALLIFHLVFSSFTFEGVDMSMAEKILNYNIKRYPNGTSL